MRYILPLFSVSTICAINFSAFAGTKLLFSVECRDKKQNSKNRAYIDVFSNDTKITAYLTGVERPKWLSCITNQSNELVCHLDDSVGVDDEDDDDPMIDIHTFRKTADNIMTYTHHFVWSGITLNFQYICNKL